MMNPSVIGKIQLLSDMPIKNGAFSFNKAVICLLIVIAALSSGQAWGFPANYSSSIPIINGDPARVAIDPATGIIFVAVPRLGKVLMLTQDGKQVSSIDSFERPLSVAVDSSGQLYVGNLTDGSVTVMDSNLENPFPLGNGAGEFGMPGDITVSQNGLVYVTDSKDNKVKVYDSTTGAHQFSFGTAGSSAGQMKFPTGITYNDANQEVFVVDQANGRVQVFSFDGIYQRSFGIYGSGAGRLTRPQGIFLSDNNAYVVDAFQSVVEEFDVNGNFASFIGGFGAGDGQFKIPADVAISSSKMFVTNTENSRIEVLDILNPQGLAITPSSIVIDTDMNVNPPTQSVDLAALVPGNIVTWTTSVSAPFGVTLSQTSGTTPSTVTLDIDVSGLSAGSYVGGITFHSQDGTEYPLTVVVDITQTVFELLVSPDSITMTYEDALLTSETISVDSSGASLAWTAATNVPWLTLSASSGSTPDSLTVSLNDNVNSLSDGVYTANVTITVPGALNSPASVPVILNVIRQKLNVSPGSATMIYQNGVLTSQSISVTSNSNITWTGTADVPWLTLSASSGSTPSDVTASLNGNVNNLTDGQYDAVITISAVEPNVIGSPATIPVTLTVIRQQLLVSPNTLNMFHQINGTLDSNVLLIDSSGGVLDWTATADVPWLTVSTSSGSTSATVPISLNQLSDSLPEGFHNATVSVTSPNAINSPTAVSVSLNVVVAGTVIVNTNLDTASFSISGNVSYTGSGINWRDDEIVPGTYSIHFNHVEGYRRPAQQTFDINSGESVTIDAVYRQLPVANVIAAAKGPNKANDAVIKILDLNGNTVNQFLALSTSYGARVAMGDTDGDGNYEIIAAPGNGSRNEALFKVFRSDGSLITDIQPLAGTIYGADVAAGDIDGDGRAEIAMSVLDSNKKTNSVIVYSVNPNNEVDQRSSFSIQSSNRITSVAELAFGDVDGDGWLELIVSSGESNSTNIVSIYAFDESLNAIPVGSDIYPNGSSVCAMDLNGEGVDEVAIGYSDGVDAQVMYLNGDLTDYGDPPLKVFAEDDNMNTKVAPNISAMDTDGDAIPDLLAGLGDSSKNPAIMRIFDNYGFTEIEAFINISNGVDVAFGVIQ
jgi:hypothetical protein